MNELSHYPYCNRRPPRADYIFRLVSRLLLVNALLLAPCCNAETSPTTRIKGNNIQRGIQETKDVLNSQCQQQDFVLTVINEFYLLDLLGSKGEVDQDQLKDLEESFLNTLATLLPSVATCPFLENIEFNISLIADTIDQQTDVVSSSQQLFSDIMWLQTLLCIPSKCESPTSISAKQDKCL